MAGQSDHGATPLSAHVIALVLVVVALAGCIQAERGDDEPAGDPPPEADPQLVLFFSTLALDRHVVLQTDHGAFRLHLYESLMPVTTQRFIELVEAGFYDGTQVHRIVERFVIQGGDPTGTGLGGSLQNIPHERDERLLFGHGALGLARGLDEDSGDSQWFVTLTPQPHLSDPESDTAGVFGLYSLFGQIVDGMEIVRSISLVPTIPGLDRPVDPPVVQHAEVVDGEPETHDLLGLPRTIHDRTRAGDWGLDVDRPMHLFAGHPFTLGVHLRPGDTSGDAPEDVLVWYQWNGTDADPERTHTAVLHRVDGDPHTFFGTVILPHAGEWDQTVRVGTQAGATGTVAVHEWHDDYVLFAGAG